MSNKSDCPCYSGELYSTCCRPYHRRIKAPATPVDLMRSRYAAYALSNISYIIDTTHPDSPIRQSNQSLWKAELRKFCEKTDFVGLSILQSQGAFVTFHAQLQEGSADVSFMERSEFSLHNGKWYYVRPL